MISHKELIDNGYEYEGEWNSRDFYSKNGFELVSHNGVYRRNSKNLSGYGKKFKTIEDLNDAYKKWAENFIEKFEQVLIAIKESLKK